MAPFFARTLIPASSSTPFHLLAPESGPTAHNYATAQQLTNEPHVSVHQALPPPQLKPTANLYLCSTANNATAALAGGEEAGSEKAFVELVEKSYKELTSRKIKDTLSSFLPKVPGEVDSTDTHPETMLQDLIEHRPIGGKEFHPLSNQALLGFRLKPGQLPEQFKMDPALLESKPHHRKKKRKHKTIDKSEEGADPAMGVANTQVEMPDDACSFIKTDPVPSIRPAVTMMPGGSSTTVIARNPVYVQGAGLTPGLAAPAAPLMDQIINYEKEKRKKKRNKDKKERKEKKEKKRKRDKHHGQEAHGPTPSQPTPLPPSLPPHTYTQYPTQYNVQ